VNSLSANIAQGYHAALSLRCSAVDALVVAHAEPAGTVLTSDPRDLDALAAHAESVDVIRV
jgi:hypothetical protein